MKITKLPKMRNAFQEIKALNVRLDVAMETLRQIAATPRNRGARRNALATVGFIEECLK